MQTVAVAHARFNGISISHDLTPKQSKDVKKLIATAKKEHEDHSSEDVRNFRFLVVAW